MLQSAGERNRLIRVMAPSITYDEFNQPTSGWTQVVSTYASWRRTGANERLAASQVGAQVTDVFEALWSPALADAGPAHRLLYGGRTYDIIDVAEVGMREGLLITAAARTDTAAVVLPPAPAPSLDFSNVDNSQYLPLFYIGTVPDFAVPMMDFSVAANSQYVPLA